MKNYYLTFIFFALTLFTHAQILTGDSSEVGITEGQLSVSLSGGATYAIPIAVPPGINGIVPQISLTYNSQGGNGMAGYGWNISGVSAITRIPRTKFHDESVGGVNLDVNDRFALDGQRLLVKQGSGGIYGADRTIYETESFSNIKITSYGVHPNGANYGPAYFIVEYPDGSKAFYGNSTDSRSLTDWAINYWENPQQIRISYSYTFANNILNITSIKYGSKLTTIPINEIQFIYKTRERPEQIYIGGQKIINTKILSDIKVVSNGIGFRNYILTQESTSLGYQRLINIVEKSGDNSKSYNPTVFSYDTTVSDTPLKAKEPALIGLSDINFNNVSYISGDFNDDGKTDIIMYPTRGDDDKKKYWIYSNIIPGVLNIPKEENIDLFKEIFPTTFLSADNKILPQGWTIAKKNATNYTFSVYGLGSTSSTIKHYEKVVNFPLDIIDEVCNTTCKIISSTSSMFPKEFYSGDFNGDGLTDVLAIDVGSTTSSYCGDDGGRRCLTQSQKISSRKIYFIDLKRDNTTNFLSDAGQLLDVLAPNHKIYVADFNGDGKSDIYIFEPNYIKIYTLNDLNKLVLLYQNTISDPSIMLDKSILFGDYNGDGKTDFIIPSALNQDSWNFYLSTGSTFVKTNTAIGVSYKTYEHGAYGVKGWNSNTYSHNDMTFIANDYNGDGKTDILFQQNLTVDRIGSNYDQNGASQITKLVLLENKSLANGSVSFSMINTSSQIAGMKRFPIPVFTNHDKINQNLEYSLISDNIIQSFNSPKDNREDVLLKGITTGNGVKENITYRPLKQDQYEPIYTPTPLTETFPNIDISVAPGFKIVTQLEKKSAATYKKQLFNYSGAVSNLNGLGFLGFRSTTRTNWHDDKTAMITSLALNDISLRGANVEGYTVLGYHPVLTLPPAGPKMPKTIIKEENYTITGSENLIATQQIILKPNTWIKQGSTFSAKINAATDTSSSNPPANYTTKTITAHESELLSNKVFKLKNTNTKHFNGLENTSSETTTTFDEYHNPISTTTVLKEGGTVVQTSTGTAKYQTATASPYSVGRPESKIQTIAIPGDVATTEEMYEYNSNFLLWKIKKRADASTSYIIEENAYDGFGNITNKTITAGTDKRVTNYQYDPTGRFLIKSTDIEGVTTEFIYNPNSTLKSETNPYGLTTSYEYDSWFKKTKTTDYLGKSNNYLYTRINEKTLITTTGDDGSASEELFDDLGRKIKSGVKNINNAFSYVDYQYDIYDRNYSVSEPYFGSSTTQWNTVEYDDYGRVKTTIAFTGKIINTQYSRLTTTVNEGTKTKTIIKNAIGNVVSMTETPGGTITYAYFANGNLRESDFGGIKTIIKQDPWGRKTELNDSSAGIYKYKYNDFGEIISEETPNGITSYTLSSLGRLDSKTIKKPKESTNSSTLYTYDGTSKLLIKTDFNDQISNTTITTGYGYDANKRIIKTTEASSTGAIFTKDISYDAFGRVENETATALLTGKTSAKTIKNTYKNGAHWQMLDNGAVVWQTNTINARGQLLTATMSNGNIAVTNAYDTYGYTTQIKHDRMSVAPGNILTLNTVFDPKKGNLTSRTNSLFGWNESFKYDTLDRLTEFINTQGKKEIQQYDDKGRITQNDLGIYGYKNDKPYQNNAITLTPEAEAYYTAKPSQIITYSTFKSPIQIEEKGIDKLSFVYNDNNDRHIMYYGGVQDEKLLRNYRKYYSADGSMEIKQDMTTGSIEFVTYIGGDGYSAPAVVKSDGTTQNYLYLQRDYQGSILAITDPSGVVQEKRLFDAWGGIIKVQNGANVDLTGVTLLDRGYTGHEHLQSVGLINMNGRLYDAKLHRFLQPDNYVQDPSNTQNYNRYSYVLNNPLKYTDPSGEFWNIVVGAVIGGVTNWATNGFQFNAKGLGYFGVGAAAGALTAMGAGGVSSALAGGSFSAGALGTSAALSVGSSFASGAIVGAAGGLVGGFTAGFGNSLVDGKNIGDSFKYGIRDGGIGAITGGLVGGVAGGLDAAMEGRNFWNGNGQTIDYVKVPANTISNDMYVSNNEMRADYNSNIGSRDGLGLEQIEKRLKTSVSLGQADNLPSGWNLSSEGAINNGSAYAGGITVRNFSGGKITSNIFMSPAVKGYDLSIRNMLFKHEFMHAWHLNSGFRGYNTYSERATSTFSVAYANAHGYGFMAGTWRSDMGPYPQQFSWRNFNKIIPLWIN